MVLLYCCYCRFPHSFRVHKCKLEGVCRRSCMQRNEDSFSALPLWLPPNMYGWGQDQAPTFPQVKIKFLKSCGDFFNFPEEWTSFCDSGWNTCNKCSSSSGGVFSFVCLFFISALFSTQPHLSCNNSFLVTNLRMSSSRRGMSTKAFLLELHLCPVQSGTEDVVASLVWLSSALFFTN